jgi:hypothetical protein
MGTFFAIVIVLGAGGMIWLNIWLSGDASTRKAAASRRRQAVADRQARIVCPHCQMAGQVTVRAVSRKKGVSGGKATGALLTGGASMLLTGLSRKEPARVLSCGNCGMTWDVA